MAYVNYRVFIFFASAQVVNVGYMCSVKSDCSFLVLHLCM
jgi:hypothetical protein